MTNKQYAEIKVMINEAIRELTLAGNTGSQASVVMDGHINNADEKIEEIWDYRQECWDKTYIKRR